MPVGDVLVGDAGGNIEHDDTALAVDVVTITETTELLLAGSIPDVELNLSEVLRWALESDHSLQAPASWRRIGRVVCRLTVVKPRG